MSRAIVTKWLALVSIGLLGFALSSAGASGASVSCGEIAFNPGTTLRSSNYGVGNIRASKVGCPEARKVAAAVKNRGGLSYSARAFKCKGKATSSAAGARKNWRCTRTRTVRAGKRKKTETQTVTFFSLGV